MININVVYNVETGKPIQACERHESFDFVENTLVTNLSDIGVQFTDNRILLVFSGYSIQVVHTVVLSRWERTVMKPLLFHYYFFSIYEIQTP